MTKGKTHKKKIISIRLTNLKYVRIEICCMNMKHNSYDRLNNISDNLNLQGEKKNHLLG